MRRSDGVVEAIEINYLTFYAHNGWYDIGYLGLLKVGAHDGDWEHLTVRLCSKTGALQVKPYISLPSFRLTWKLVPQMTGRSAL